MHVWQAGIVMIPYMQMLKSITCDSLGILLLLVTLWTKLLATTYCMRTSDLGAVQDEEQYSS